MRKLIYIVGCANCGSTLLTKLLARHSAIATVGELKATAMRNPKDYVCGCGALLLQCEFWRKVQAICLRKNVKFDLTNFQTQFCGNGWLQDKAIRTRVRTPSFEWLRDVFLAAYPGAKARVSRIARRNAVLIDAICEAQKRSVFLDGSKDPIRLKHFFQSGLFDVRAIHLVRDGRAIIASYKKREPSLQRCLDEWRTKAMECERVKALIPSGRILTLRYEDLCRDVPAVLADIWRFVGVPDEQASVAAPGSDGQHIIGHNMRLAASGEIKERAEWKQLLDQRELAAFYAVGTALNEKYAYA